MSIKQTSLLLIRNGFKPLESVVANVTRRFPPLSLFRKFVLPHNQQTAGQTRRLYRNGLVYEVDLSDYIDWKLYFQPWSKERKTLFSLVKKGDFVVDIGSHKGATLLELRRVAGENAKILGFEAHPDNFQHCKHNIELNHFTNVDLRQVALGSETGSITFKNALIHNSSGHRVATAKEAEREVPMQTLDAILKQHHEMPNLIKITVNGYEEQVLRGAKNTIVNSGAVLFLHLCEPMHQLYGTSTANILKLLESWHYKSFRADSHTPISSKDNFSGFDAEIFAKKI